MFMKKKRTEELRVRLPLSEKELDAFVASITEEYTLPPGDNTYDAIATMILHLPPTQSYATRSYFGHGVYKQMSNLAAYNRLKEIMERRKAAEEEKKKAELTLVPQETDAASEQPLQNA